VNKRPHAQTEGLADADRIKHSQGGGGGQQMPDAVKTAKPGREAGE